ncbi:MAG: cyclopropane-fatty-acyl-phospholipid synthase family protein [Nitriliruptoraceae bacterium]
MILTSVAHRRARSIVTGMLSRIDHGYLELSTPDGEVASFGDPRAALRTRLDVHDPAFFVRLLRGGSVGVGESYMDGEWSCDDLVALVRIVIANRPAFARIAPLAVLEIVADRAVHALRSNRRSRARANIAAHYDLSNDLYEQFLDETMTYSSAVFEHPDQSLADAQRHKFERLAEMARIGPGMRVLEIGCGWGSLAIHLAREHGCHVTGITLSERQADLARRRVREAGLTDLVDIQVVDYRDVQGTWDRVVSVEMLEAVGHRYLGTYFATIERVLADDGLVALQVITIPEQRYATYRRRPDFIQRYIFPGGHLPSLAAVTTAAGQSSRLYVDEVVNIGTHYAHTLRHWRRRFLEQLDDVRALGFDDRFARMWEFYLAYCEGAFASRYISDLQIVLTRPLNASQGLWPYEHAVQATPARTS